MSSLIIIILGGVVNMNGRLKFSYWWIVLVAAFLMAMYYVLASGGLKSGEHNRNDSVDAEVDVSKVQWVDIMA